MKKLNFRGEKFKIMQIADTQEIYPPNPDTIKLIELAIEKERPDLLIFTGDQIAGYHPCFKKDAERKIEFLLKAFTKKADELSIPYAFTFGNHDRNCGLSNEYQWDNIYSKLPNIVYGKPRSDTDKGTYVLEIAESEGGENVFALYLIDSHAKEANGDYSPVTTEQIQWLNYQRTSNRKYDGSFLPALLFQHIPFPEYFDAIKKAAPWTKGAVRYFSKNGLKYYVLPKQRADKRSFMRESPAVPMKNTGEFAAIKIHSDILGVFVGHDHNNSFSRGVDGIMLNYCQGCGFNTYGPGKRRGVRIIELDKCNLSSFQTHTVEMGDFGKFKPSRPLKEFVLAHMPSSINDSIFLGLKIAAFSAAGLILKIFIDANRR